MNISEEIHRIKEVMGISSEKPTENYIGNEIENLVVEFYNQLEFQKKVFVSVSNSLSESDKYNYIKKIEREQVNYLFSNDKVILESYEIIFPKFIISENTFNLIDEITKFNDFLFTSICNKVGFVKENLVTWVKKQISEQRISDLPQNQNPDDKLSDEEYFNKYGVSRGIKPNIGTPPKTKDLRTTLSPQQQQQIKDMTRGQKDLSKVYYGSKQKPKEETNILSNAINYIKQNGIAAVMEGLRSSLLSISGMAVQAVLSFTGAGGIVNEVAWGMLTLYDGYQYFVNGSGGIYLMYLIIDLICLATAGSLSKVLKGYVGKAASSVSEGIKLFMEGGIGKYIKPVLETIMSAAGTVAKWLSEAATFMSEKMGIQWASKVIGSVKQFFVSVMEGISRLFGAGAGAVTNFIQRKGLQLFGTYSPSIARGFATLSAEQIEAWVGKTVTDMQLKAAEKVAEEKLKNEPTQAVLDTLDSQFGTDMGDLFAFYLNSKKLASAAKGTNITKAGADVLTGKDPTEKTGNYAKKVAKSTKELTGVR